MTPDERVIGWSDDIRIDTDPAELAIPPEDWHIVPDPDRVLTGIPSKGPTLNDQPALCEDRRRCDELIDTGPSERPNRIRTG